MRLLFYFITTIIHTNDYQLFCCCDAFLKNDTNTQRRMYKICLLVNRTLCGAAVVENIDLYNPRLAVTIGHTNGIST